MATTTNRTTDRTGRDWHEAGEAWGHRAADWSCLFEHYSFDVILALFPALGVGPGVRLLDIACGSGLAVRSAGALGASVSGIDAAAELVAVARDRSPDADVRVGSMFELPWPDGSFDAAISLNGIWGGCQEALDEAYRVLRPGGTIGLSYWGTEPPLPLRDCFLVLARHSPASHFGSMKRLNDISAPGVAEEMLRSSGFEVAESGRRTSVLEWPDADLAWRALASCGPAVPALRRGDVDELRRDVLEAIAPCRDERGVYRFANDLRFVTAHRP